MTDKRCATCRHWNAGTTSESAQLCDRISFADPDQPAFVEDHPNSNMCPNLWTRPDFGCVLWEQKP